MAVVNSVIDLVGGTPLLKINNFIASKGVKANIYAKLEYFNPAGSVKDRIAKAMIEDAYSDPFFSIEGLAEELKISTTYLRREFCRATGLSPIAYLKDARIRRASQLLLSQDITVGEIAARCGYSSISYFIQDFRKKTGESPSQYRSRLRAAP